MPDRGKSKQILGRKTKRKSSIKILIKKIKEKIVRLDIKMAIKVTVAALLSLYACFLVDSYFKHPSYLAPGLWCIISAVVVLQASIGGVYQAIWIRFIGIIIGSVVGVIVTLLFGADVLALGLAFFITILLCSLLKIPDSYGMASLSVAIIMIPWKMHPTVGPWVDAFFRFLDTCIGLIIAIFVSYLFWPSRALTKMRLNMAEMFNLYRHFFKSLLVSDSSLHKRHQFLPSLIEEVDQAFSENRKILQELRVELFVHFTSVELWLDLINCEKRLWQSLRSIYGVFSPTLEKLFDPELLKHIQRIIEVVDFALKETSVKLKEGHTKFDFNILNKFQSSLNQEMIRFRATHTTNRYSLDVVEDYFVFLYHLKQMMGLIYQFNEILDDLENVKNEAKKHDKVIGDQL